MSEVVKSTQRQLPESNEQAQTSAILRTSLIHDSQVEPLFQALLEAAPDAIVIVDQEGRIVLVNRQAEQLFGYERQELLGQEIEILIPERLRAVHRRHRTSYLADPRTRPMGVGHDRDDIWG